MACDLQMTYRDALTWKAKTKIFKFKAHESLIPEDFIVGFAGTANDMITACEFFAMPDSFKNAPHIRGLDGLVLTASGTIYLFDRLDKWMILDVPFASVGSGSPIASGAMLAGATPREAIKAATNMDPYTGMGVKTLSF
jgi:ATP-dependent protease HslVU (ClpYQ) peptidase subunit